MVAAATTFRIAPMARGPELGYGSTRPLIAVRERLAQARAEGKSFAEAWANATSDVRRGYADALSWSRESWEAAYLDERAPGCGAWSLLRESRR